MERYRRVRTQRQASSIFTPGKRRARNCRSRRRNIPAPEILVRGFFVVRRSDLLRLLLCDVLLAGPHCFLVLWIIQLRLRHWGVHVCAVSSALEVGAIRENSVHRPTVLPDQPAQITQPMRSEVEPVRALPEQLIYLTGKRWLERQRRKRSRRVP